MLTDNHIMTNSGGDTQFVGYNSRQQRSNTRQLLILGAEYPSPKKVNPSTMVRIYRPKKVKGYLLSY